MTQTAIDERHLKSLDAVVGDVGNQFNVVDVELAFGLTLGIHFAEQFYLVLVKVLAHLLNHPYIAEESSTQVSVAHHRLLDSGKMGVDEFNNLVLRLYPLGSHLVHAVGETFKFALDNGIIDILLTLEIGVKSAATLARSNSNVVHRGVLQTVLSEQLTRHIYEFLPCL